MTQLAHQEAPGDLPRATRQLRPSLAGVSLWIASVAGCAAHPTPPETTAVYADDPAAGASPLLVERWSVNEPDATTVGAHGPSSQPTEPVSAAKTTPQGTTSETVARSETAPRKSDADQADADQADTDQPGADRADADQADTDRPGADQADADPSTPSRR